MLNRTNWLLSGTLVLQVGLAAAYSSSAGEAQAGFEKTPILQGVDSSSVVGLEIQGPGGNPLELVKQDGMWIVEGGDGYPLDEAKIQQTVRDLIASEPTGVVSESGHHHRNFEVDEESFQRRIALKSDDANTETLFLGKPARGGAVHARKGDSDSVFTVKDLDSWKFSVEARDWIKKDFLTVDQSRVLGFVVQSGDKRLELVRKGPRQWDFGGSNPAGAVDASKAVNLLDRVARIRIDDVAGRRAAFDDVFTSPEIRVTLRLGNPPTPSADGDSDPLQQRWAALPKATDETSFSAAREPGGEGYLVSVVGNGYVGRVGKWTLDPLLAANAASLMPDPESTGEGPSGDAAP